MNPLRLIVALSCSAGLSLLTPHPATAQYEAWPHRATLVILTTPHGADLPAAAREENFPLLVRLIDDGFDFSQAKPDGADIRFSSDGRPLAYQIEQWNAAERQAAIWVRIPLIQGNARQEFSLHWGNVDARSESSGPAVFNEAGGHRVVMHLDDADDPARDEVGTVRPKDHGTSSCAGAVGRGRRFAEGQGIDCGEKIFNLPGGSGPCTTEAWIRAERVNGTVVAWGNEHAQGKVVMQVNGPPHVSMDCYFSAANVRSDGRLPMSQWVHVAHTYEEGATRLYINGRLDASGTSRQGPLRITRPARMGLGGWYGDFHYVGDIDEVRISGVARSADAVRLAYENQKPHQSLVGVPLRSRSTPAGSNPAGSTPDSAAFHVSPQQVVVREGQSATITAEAPGADKVYFVLRRGDEESVVSADRRAYTFHSGRIAGDGSAVLRVQAVYKNEVRTKDIPITITETIPEPVYDLAAPAAWNGRDTIEVVPQIRNLSAMKSAGAGEVRYRWVVDGGAVIKQVAPDRLILHRAQYSGPIRATSLIANGGRGVAASVTIQVAEPATNPWVERTPEPDEKPEEGQFYARDDRNEATLHYRGTLAAMPAEADGRPVESVYLKVYADDQPFCTDSVPLGGDKAYALAVKLKPGLIKYRVEFGVRIDGQDQVRDRVGNLVCGDAYLIDGQSNALATDTREDSPRETNEWIRSHGGPTGRVDGDAWLRTRTSEAERAGQARPNLWCNPVWKAKGKEHDAELGWWGMQLAKRLVADHQVPICIINAAVGGSRIDEHLPATADLSDRPVRPNPADLKTMYGRSLWRIRQARLTHGIRAVLWHQGENDQGAAGPTGGYGWETYQQFFVDLSAAWKQDMPNIRHYYVFQIWPNACAMGGKLGSGDRLREAQRTLPRLYSNMSIISTLGIKPPGGCHFPLEGWAEFARLVQPMIDRDFYGKVPATSITPPNLLRARYIGPAHDEITLEFDQPILWRDELASQIYLDDLPADASTSSVQGNILTLKLKGPSAAGKVTYLKERDWNQDRLIVGTNGIAALTFCEVEIEK